MTVSSMAIHLLPHRGLPFACSPELLPREQLLRNSLHSPVVHTHTMKHQECRALRRIHHSRELCTQLCCAAWGGGGGDLQPARLAAVFKDTGDGAAGHGLRSRFLCLPLE